MGDFITPLIGTAITQVSQILFVLAVLVVSKYLFSVLERLYTYKRMYVPYAVAFSCGVLLFLPSFFPVADTAFSFLQATRCRIILGVLLGVCVLFVLATYVLSCDTIHRIKRESVLVQWERLKDYPLSLLTRGLQEKFIERIVYALTMLGANTKAESFLCQLGDKKSTTDFRLLHRQYQAYVHGDMQAMFAASVEAEAQMTKNTVPLYAYNFYHNKAAAYQNMQDYMNAEAYFEKAYDYIRRKKITSVEEIFHFCRNYGITKLHRYGKQYDCTTVMAIFQAAMDKHNPDHWMLYYDLDLAFLHQKNANDDCVQQNVDAALKKLKSLKVKKSLLFVYAAKTARIITSHRIVPEKCLSLVQETKRAVARLSIRERYDAMSNLQYMLEKLSPEARERYSDVAQMVATYFSTSAEQELEAYRNELPFEAVYERIALTRKLIHIRKIAKRAKPYEDIKSELTSCIHICEENNLHYDALCLKLDIIDEAIAPWNNSALSGRSLYETDIVALLQEICPFVDTLKKSSIEAEADFRIAYYALQIHDYALMKTYFCRYVNSRTPPGHFADWCKHYIACTRYAVQVCMVLESISDAASQCITNSLSPESVQFLQTFRRSDGFLLLLLVYTLINRPGLGYKYCEYVQDGEIHRHYWLCNDMLGMEIDPLYHQYAMDADTERIFFFPGCHPLENGTSQTIKMAEHVTVWKQYIPPAMMTKEEGLLISELCTFVARFLCQRMNHR